MTKDAIHSRVVSLDKLTDLRETWQSRGKKVVFTNGVFDLLHRGHVTYLAAAAAHGDVLVVGVNGDASVRRLGKGPERPIVAEADRAAVVAALRSVEAVVVFDTDTPLALIQHLQPDVLAKGGDYDASVSDPEDPQYIVGSAEIRAYGGTVTTIDLVPGQSTTGMAEKLKNG